MYRCLNELMTAPDKLAKLWTDDQNCWWINKKAKDVAHIFHNCPNHVHQFSSGCDPVWTDTSGSCEISVCQTAGKSITVTGVVPAHTPLHSEWLAHGFFIFFPFWHFLSRSVFLCDHWRTQVYIFNIVESINSSCAAFTMNTCGFQLRCNWNITPELLSWRKP